MQKEIFLFFIFVMNGFLIGIVFDMFRVLRKSFKTADIIIYLEDVLFWLIAGTIVLVSIFKFNNGEIRGYLFFSIFIGMILYGLIFSKVFMKVNVVILNLVKKIFYTIIKVLLYPIHFLLKISVVIISPISKIIFFLKANIFRKFFKFLSILLKNAKKTRKKVKKEGF